MSSAYPHPSTFLDFSEFHPAFKAQCLALDLDRVAAMIQGSIKKSGRYMEHEDIRSELALFLLSNSGLRSWDPSRSRLEGYLVTAMTNNLAPDAGVVRVEKPRMRDSSHVTAGKLLAMTRAISLSDAENDTSGGTDIDRLLGTAIAPESPQAGFATHDPVQEALLETEASDLLRECCPTVYERVRPGGHPKNLPGKPGCAERMRRVRAELCHLAERQGAPLPSNVIEEAARFCGPLWRGSRGRYTRRDRTDGAAGPRPDEPSNDPVPVAHAASA